MPMNRIFAFFILFWKFLKRTKVHSLADMDLMSGRHEIDQMEGKWVEPTPRNVFEKVCVLIHD